MKKRHTLKRFAGLVLAAALAVSLVGGTGLPAWTAAETAQAAEAATLSGGETITEGGTYRLADGATGTVTVSTTEAVVIEGSGVSWDDDYVMDCTEYEDLHFDCVAGADLTLKDAFITNNGTETASLVDFTGSGNRLSIEGTVVLENSGLLYALVHVGEGTSLTVAGTGTLYLYKYNQGAGIGGNPGELNGDITFGDDESSLTVFAKGSKQGALIGAGADAASEEADPGTISFVEGTYNLVSVSRGAVVGGSAGSGGASDGTTVCVGPKVNMNINVDYSGAAVGGGGYDGGNDSSGGTLYVTGGSLRCYIDSNAAGNTTGWNGKGYTAGVNDAAITAQRLNGDGEAVYWSAFNTGLLYEEAEYFEVYVDGELFYEGSLPEYGFVQEGLDKSEQLSITSTVSNWYKNGETNLYFYLTGEDHTVVVNGEEFSCTWDSDAEGFTFAEVVAATYDVTQNLENITASGDTVVRDGRKYKTTLTAADGYVLPEAITVSVAGTELTAGTGYSYSNITGELVVSNSYTTGDITITASAVADTFAVSVTAGDTISYYGTVEEAFAYANTLGTSCTVSLRTDCTVTESLAAGSGSEVTLDLAGYTLAAGENSSLSVLTVNGSLTVTDSSEDGSGTVTGGTGTIMDGVTYGGGIYVPSGGTLTVTGGCVTGNTADYGGGIYAASGSSLAMTGGSVTANTAPYGGGVYMAGAVSLSGTPVVSGNMAADSSDDTENNLYLVSGNTVTLAGSLEEGAQAGITTEDAPSDGVTVPVTAAETDTSYYMRAVDYITSDAGYYVAADTDAGCLVFSEQEVCVASVETEDGTVAYYTGIGGAFSAVNALDGAGTIVLQADCETTESLAVDSGHTAILDLNGHTLAAKDGASISVITVNGMLTLTDSSDDGDGLVTGGTGTTVGSGIYGGGVYVSSEGSFYMDGGNIAGNCLTVPSGGSGSLYGGGVYSNGSFTMAGGSITENTLTINGSGSTYGGGVYCTGSVTMTGGSISGNTMTGSGTSGSTMGGGGVYADGIFTMTAGSISGNTLKNANSVEGGGVRCIGGSAMYGGEISNNKVSTTKYVKTAYGAGVRSTGTFVFYGGEITGNAFSGAGNYGEAYGGGICASTLYMFGGEINGNTLKTYKKTYGGGVSCSKAVILDGCITGNTSAGGPYIEGYGGGIYMTGSVAVNGGSITGNTAGNGSCVYGTGTLTISGETASTPYEEDIVIDGYGIGGELENISMDGGTAVSGENFTTKLVPDDYYMLPEEVTLDYPASGTYLTEGEDYSYNAEDGTLTIYASAITGSIRVSAQGIAPYSVSASLEGVSMEGDTLVAYGSDYTSVLLAEQYYCLPEGITVVSGGTELVSGEGYVYDADSGSLTVYAAYITGDIDITASGTVLSYGVSMALTNISSSGASRAAAGSDYDAVLAADAYYALPEQVSVTVDGTELVSGEGYAYDSGSGSLTVYAAYITGDLVITADGVQAVDMEQDGEGYYLLYSEDDILAFAFLVTDVDAGACARLMADISVSADSGFAGIGTADTPYAGMFDGDGHTVTLEVSTDGAAGLFAYVSGASIHDVVTAGTVETSVNTYGCAGIASYVMADGITIENCVNGADISGTGYVGGLIGRTESSSVIVLVTGSSNEGNVTGTGSYVGGIAARMYEGSLDGCMNYGTVIGTGYVGGIVGYAYSTGSLKVLECGNEGSVTGTGSYTGGITGYARLASSGQLSMGSLYNAGTVSGTSYVGGITGRNCASLYDVYNTGTVTGTAVTTGGVTGNNYAGGAVLSNAYNAGEVAYTSSGVAYAGGLLAGSITGASYKLYVDNAYYLSTLDGSAVASGSSYLYSYSTQAAITDEELAAMAKTSDELAALADTLGDSFVENTDSGYHLGYPVLAWEKAGDDAEELQIITQPEDYTGTAGSTAVFEVEASGSGLSYQWQYLNVGASTWRDSGMGGADTSSISVPVTEARDGQQYRCIVTDADGNTVTSDAATLTVSGAAGLAITLQPSDYTGEEGSTAIFTVEADGAGLTYQWQYKSPGGTMWHDSGMTGADTATLSVPITAARDGQQYRCIVTDENGDSAISDTATLTVSDGSALRITLQPSDYTGAVGDTAAFTVEAEGDGLAYQWQYKSPGGTMWHDSGMDGADTAALSVPITAARDGQQYRCVVTDADGNTVTSDAAALYVSGTD